MPEGEPTAIVRERVLAARERMKARQGKLNSELLGRALRQHAALSPGSEALLQAASRRLALTARGYDRTLRVARTYRLKPAPRPCQNGLLQQREHPPAPRHGPARVRPAFLPSWSPGALPRITCGIFWFWRRRVSWPHPRALGLLEVAGGRRFHRLPPLGPEALTVREREVLRRVALGVSRRTVYNWVSSLGEKSGADCAVLLRYAPVLPAVARQVSFYWLRYEFLTCIHGG